MTSTPLGKFSSLSTLTLTGGAEISAFHPAAKLLLTIGGSDILSVVDLSDPTKPALLTSLTLAGVVNSVAVSSTGLVAVAVEGASTSRYTDGKVAFFKVAGVGSAATVTAAGSVAVGIVPDSIAFTPDGTKLVVANEGEPNELYTVDPEGSVSVISIDGITPANSSVQTVAFTGLNGRDAELAALGIRLGGKSGSTVAQNLEPEYVAISADGKKAYVTFQENNAVGVIKLDGTTPTLESLRSVGVQDYVRGQASIKSYDVTIASPGTTAAGGVVPGGGLSGLYSTGKDADGRLTFLAPADRGPNGSGTTKDVVKADGSAGTDGTLDAVQPFLLPDYQARFYKLALNETTGVVSVTGEVKLTRKDGTTPITGRSNGKGDQIPVDANGNLLSYDTYGADLESIVQDKDGNIWMSDEYRPAIYKFDSTGKLIERYVPAGAGVAAGLSAGALGAETLPAEYAKRQTNRGFEGLAYDAVNGKLFAFVQSPLDDVGTNDGTKGSIVRILEVSASTGNPTAEYLYPMAGKGSATAAADSPFYESKVDKIGDVAYDAARHVVYVLERDSTAGALSYKQVFEVSLKGATNILGNAVSNEENLSIDALKLQGISVANKVLLTNLSSEGYLPNDKPEGLAMLADGRLAVVNDNDFGVTGLDASAYNALTTLEKAKYSLASDIGGSQTYVYAKGADAKTQLGIISFTPTGIDPSDKDAKIALLNNQNIYGLRMPDGIAAFQALGKDGISQTFTVIANEGDTRVRPDGDYTVNGTTTKDSTVFVDELRSGVTGTGTDNRLKIITDLGNYDATTAAYEQKFVFGGRSISILDSLGNVIWDSGDAIDKAAIAAGTYDDTRSDDKGSEPENVTVATVDGKTYAFVALERSGGVVSFEITDPYNASLVSYNKSATGVVSPEGIIVIPADKSPNGRTLLVTSNEVSKQLEVLAQDYTLQLLHYYGESGLLGVKTAPIMGALIDRFDDQYANTLVIGEGDSFIPGPWLVGGADPSLNGLSALGDTSSTDTKSDGVTALGRPDVAIMNLFGTNVSALGNHEFDLGSPVLSSAIAASGNWKGAQFPLITSNLNFSADSSLKGLADSSLGGTATNAFAGKEASDIKSKIAPYTVVTKGGEKIGIVGATTWNLLEKSSPNGTKVLDDANDATSDLQEVAAYVQASVDKLILAGVNKIIMIDQLDGMIDRNKALAPLLKGVDVMVAGGGHERHGDSTDTAVPFNGHDANFIPEGYPLVVKDADGKDTLIVTSDTEYSYLGRLVVRFDSNGNVIVPDLNPAINGAYASTEASLQAAYGSTKTSAQIISSSTIGMAVGDIANAIDNVIASKDGAIYGYTSVYLEGDRVYGRAQEVNLGNLSADANLYAASRILPAGTVLGSLKNGGGIRASIGSVNADGTKLRPAETSVKSTGAISQLEVENALRFDNKLMVFDTNPTGLLAILNYAAGLSAGNGGYAQIGGVRFSFDPTKEAGKKVQDVAVYDLGGNLLAKVADNGVILASAPKTITLSTLNFMAQGGDGYPIKANGENFRYLLSNSNGSISVSAAISEDQDFSAAATYAAYPNVLGEQDAFKSYLKAFHGTPETAYTTADTIQSVDQRIQSLGVKPLDTVFPDSNIRLFNSGVASGDPYADSVILWTRIDPANTFSSSVAVDWEVFTSPTFSTNSIIDKGTFTTNKDRDWTVKVEADGLNPDTTYYYRFRVGDVVSMVGQTKTLPVDSGAVHLAVFSCANFPAADTFAAYGRAAAINAVNPYDAWVHLGDYIYEYGPGGYGVAESAASTRGYSPNREIVSLDDYRQRYAQYHSDSNLQALRAAAPLIAIWDDHETANDSYAEGAENHQPLTEGEWIARRDAALQAYYEWVPIREPLLRDGTDQGTVQTPLTKGYRSFDFGDVLSLHVLETRLTARDKQLAYPDATAVQTRLGAILQSPSSISAYATKYGVAAPTSAADATRFATALAPYVTNELVAAVVGEAYAANREMMGKEELDWLKSEMATSQARWQVLGQQVLMQSMAVPAELLLNAGNPALLDKYAAPLQKLATGTAFTALSAAEQALFSEAGKIPYNLDAWDGYGLERETILQSALAMGKRLISLAGDTHNAWAGVLDTMAAGIKPAGTVAGVEFATPGVTSPGFEKYLPGADAYIRAKYPAVDGLDGLFTGYVNGLKYADLNRRGFLDLTITPDQAVGNFQLLNGVDQTSGIASWSSETVAASANFSLRLNGAPSGISLVNATSYLAENTSTTSRTKVADIVISDDNLGANVISLSGPDANNFEVIGTALFIKAGTVLNYEVKTSYTVSVRVTDPDLSPSNPVSSTYSLVLFDVSEASDPIRVGTAGNDSTLPGESTISGFDGRLDTVFTGAGDDEIDIAVTGGGDNKIFTGSGADMIFAGSRDVITGGSGNDSIVAETGNGNRLSGNGGDDDFIIGSSGNRALGGDGNDTFQINEGAGTNYLNGGAGKDTFWLISSPGDMPGAKQFVMDFKSGEDKVRLSSVSFNSLSFSQVGGDTILKVDGTEVGHFMNMGSSILNNQANFLFS